MGNGYAKLTRCFSGDRRRRRHVASAVTWEPYDEGLGHSFAYFRPDSGGGGAVSGPLCSSSSPPYDPTAAVSGEETTTFRSISGASVSANTSTPLSTALLVDSVAVAAAAFESSTSFSAVRLQPLPRFSGLLSGPLGDVGSGADRGFMSGPIERGFMSGPLDHRAALFSGPLDKPQRPSLSAQLRRSLSHGLPKSRRVGGSAQSLLRGLTKAIARTITAPSTAKGLKGAAFVDDGVGSNHCAANASGRNSVEAGQWSDSPEFIDGGLQWAQGKAGEDRVHVVVSDEHGWVFVGIYDGFNGPDATDYLLCNLYDAVHGELKGLLWDDKSEAFRSHLHDIVSPDTADELYGVTEMTCDADNGCCIEGREVSNKRRKRVLGNVGVEDWKKKISEIDKSLREQFSRSGYDESMNHSLVLKALSRALKKTEDTYLAIADKMVVENPELALMGSCVLVMLMKGDDVYLMSVGDSRAILAQKMDTDVWRKQRQDLEKINEEAANNIEIYDPFFGVSSLAAMQLNLEHSTSVEEEVQRIRKEHPDDSSAITNDRVKGSLKVTRAFGAGFLKQPKWNDVLLQMFRIDYVGSSAYLTCNPFLYHHKLGPKDKFLILSSDGLYQYLTNEEAVTQVEMFIATTPEGDPAQHLVEEVLFRAAKQAGMDFHELLEVPQGDRRRYHDDISIIIISLEGRIWRSCL